MRLAFGTGVFAGDIWIYDSQRDTQQKLTSTPGVNTTPVWTPDGKGIVYRSRSAAQVSLYWIRSDGVADAVKLLDSKTDTKRYSFSPKGDRLAYHDESGNGGGDIWTLPMDWSDSEYPKAGKPNSFSAPRAGQRFPALSPDGHWIAYQNSNLNSNLNNSILVDIYVQPFPANPRPLELPTFPCGKSQCGGDFSSRATTAARQLFDGTLLWEFHEHFDRTAYSAQVLCRPSNPPVVHPTGSFESFLQSIG